VDSQDLLRRGLEEAGLSEKESGAGLLDAVVQFFCRFVFMTAAQAVAVALWSAHTWAIEAAEATPFLDVTSPEPESGKTRLLEVAEMLVRRPLRAASLSAAVLYTVVQKESPTLLIDETDSIFGPKAKAENEELRGLLNAGNRRGSKTYRCAWEGRRRVIEAFEVFCPRALAGIGRLPETIEKRSFIIRLKRQTKREQAEKLGPRERKRVEPEAYELRVQLQQWADANIHVLREADPEFPGGLTDRQEEGAQPLLAIADLAGGEWPEKARQALIELCTGATPEDDSLGIRLLRDCWTAFDAQGVDRLSSADLCSALVAMDESPWGELNKGRPLTLRGLARLIHPFDVASGTIRLDDGATAKGYYRISFEDAWSRWLPVPDPQNGTTSQLNAGGSFLDFSIRHTENPATDEKCEIVTADGPCDAVTDEMPAEGCRYFVGERRAGPCFKCGVSACDHVNG
jgi:hypothetical protein